MAGLRIRWIDHRGKVWHLTEGTEGVILDVGQTGLDWSPIEHTFTGGDLIHAAATVSRPTHTLKVLVGWDLAGDAYYRLNTEWWEQANSPFHLGTLEVTRPDGVTRSRRLRLAESPETTYNYDPGTRNEDRQPELWALTGDDAWWYGVEQSVVFTNASVTGAGSTPFYGNPPHKWPLYISSPGVAADAWVSNSGQGDMWLKWTIVGPATSVLVGVTGSGVLAYSGSVADGEVVEIDTDPAHRSVTETVSNANRYGFVTGKYAPVPVGDRVPLTIRAEGISPTTSITVTGRAAYARAF